MSFTSGKANRTLEAESYWHPRRVWTGHSVSCYPQPHSRQLRGRVASSLAVWEFNLTILQLLRLDIEVPSKEHYLLFPVCEVNSFFLSFPSQPASFMKRSTNKV